VKIDSTAHTIDTIIVTIQNSIDDSVSLGEGGLPSVKIMHESCLSKHVTYSVDNMYTRINKKLI
jgi:hypothetical protein